MYKLLLVLASAAALKRPQRALAVRGGEMDPIQVGKGIHGGRIVIRPKPELCAAEAEAPPLDLAAAAAAGAAGDAASAPSW